MRKGSKQDLIGCWIRSEPTKTKYIQRMKRIWDEVKVLASTEQKLADQATISHINY